MTIAVVLFSLLFNTVGAKHLPLFESMILFLHIFGFFAILIPLWVLAPKVPAKTVFTDFQNFGGWDSVGGACIIGSLTAIGSVGGSDSPARELWRGRTKCDTPLKSSQILRKKSVTLPRSFHV